MRAVLAIQVWADGVVVVVHVVAVAVHVAVVVHVGRVVGVVARRAKPPHH